MVGTNLRGGSLMLEPLETRRLGDGDPISLDISVTAQDSNVTSVSVSATGSTSLGFESLDMSLTASGTWAGGNNPFTSSFSATFSSSADPSLNGSGSLTVVAYWDSQESKILYSISLGADFSTGNGIANASVTAGKNEDGFFGEGDISYPLNDHISITVSGSFNEGSGTASIYAGISFHF